MGVTIIGYADLPARMANHASAMYAQNMALLLKHVHGKERRQLGSCQTCTVTRRPAKIVTVSLAASFATGMG